MGRARTAAVYWLIPARAERELFFSLIRILARELDAPLFEPHLTLFSTTEDGRSAAKHLKKVQAGPVSLTIRDVQFSAVFTKTLFVRFRPSAALHRFVARLQRNAGLPLRKISDPHLSLCYKKLPAKSKRELLSAIRLPLREVAFDCLKVVVCPVPTRTAEEVKAWRVIGRKKLAD